MSIEYVIEVCAVELQIENLLLIIIYWNRREEAKFYKQLKQILDYLNKKDSRLNIVIGGDFNINVLDSNLKTNQFLDLMLEFNFVQHIKVPTRVTQTTSTCLDLIFTNSNIRSHTTVEELGFSDHSGTILKLAVPRHARQIAWCVEKRLFNSKNTQCFKSKLKETNWNDIIKPGRDIDENYESFNNTLTGILNQSIPKTKLKLKTNYKKHWLTKGIKISCKNKRLEKILSIKTDNHLIKQHYKIYEKTLKQIVNKAKKLQYINKLMKSNNKVKTMWKIINERTNKNVKKVKKNITLHLNNNVISDPKQTANIFNSFFASIGEGNAQTPGREPRSTSVAHRTENTMFLSTVGPAEINSIIKNLKNKNSYGIDEMPPALVKQCADELTLPFYLLVNQSFEEGRFPNYLKKAVIKPIHKKDSKSDPTNYRPIALLPTASKIFEKAMCNRVYSFCEKYKIFNESQYGFRKNHSTVLAVYNFIQEAINMINKKEYAVGILLDMTKAYDKVQFDILLNKLQGIGIRGKSYEWFKSYLENREHQVEIEYYNEYEKQIQYIRSDSKQINASIPQGSVIGCLLFIIYINDLPSIINEPCVLFADDISVLTSCQDNTNLTEILKSILNKIITWMTEHNLELNFNKTKIMSFHPRQKTPLDITFIYNGAKLETVKEFNLLGLSIDTNLNWKSHIQKIKSKLSKFAYALREIKKTTNLTTALVTYYAYAYAWLNYGVILWGNSTDAPTLFTLQKRLIRILANIDDTDSCKPHFQEHKLLTLPCIYILEMCKFVKNNQKLFTTREQIQTNYTLRHKNRLNLPGSKLKIHSTSTLVMSVKIYNKLPDAIKNEVKFNIFINKLKQLLIRKCYYNVNEYLNDKLNK